MSLINLVSTNVGLLYHLFHLTKHEILLSEGPPTCKIIHSCAYTETELNILYLFKLHFYQHLVLVKHYSLYNQNISNRKVTLGSKSFKHVEHVHKGLKQHFKLYFKEKN